MCVCVYVCVCVHVCVCVSTSSYPLSDVKNTKVSSFNPFKRTAFITCPTDQSTSRYVYTWKKCIAVSACMYAYVYSYSSQNKYNNIIYLVLILLTNV